MNTSVAEPTYEDLVGPEAVKDEELEVGANSPLMICFPDCRELFQSPII